MAKTLIVELWIPDDATQAPEPGDYHRFDRSTLAAWLATAGDVTARELSNKDITERANNLAHHEYRDSIAGIVEDVKRAIKDGEITDRDAAMEYIEQTIDGHHDVIYTYAAQEVCRQSENDAAYFDDFGTDGAVGDGGIEWSKLAYSAMRADVFEEIGDLDDLFAEDEDEDEDDDAEV